MAYKEDKEVFFSIELIAREYYIMRMESMHMRLFNTELVEIGKARIPFRIMNFDGKLAISEIQIF